MIKSGEDAFMLYIKYNIIKIARLELLDDCCIRSLEHSKNRENQVFFFVCVNWLPKYKDSKFLGKSIGRRFMNGSATQWPTIFFFSMELRTTFFQELGTFDFHLSGQLARINDKDVRRHSRESLDGWKNILKGRKKQKLSSRKFKFFPNFNPVEF